MGTHGRRQAPRHRLTVRDNAQAFEAMDAGKADAWAGDDVVLTAAAAEAKRAQDYVVLGDFLSYDPYGIMYRKNDPAMDALVITPIAPHTLTNRPIVIPASREVRVESTTPSDGIHVTFDGQSGFPLAAGQAVTIGRAPRPLRLVRASTRSYFEALRQKLKWHER